MMTHAVLEIKRKQNSPNLSCSFSYPYNNNNVSYRYYRQVTDTYFLAICSILKAHFMLLLSGGWGGGGGKGRGRVRDFRSKNPDLDLYCQPTRLLNTLFSTLFCTEFAVFLQLYPLAHNILIHP